jgi:hypothetical protein
MRPFGYIDGIIEHPKILLIWLWNCIMIHFTIKTSNLITGYMWSCRNKYDSILAVEVMKINSHIVCNFYPKGKCKFKLDFHKRDFKKTSWTWDKYRKFPNSSLTKRDLIFKFTRYFELSVILYCRSLGNIIIWYLERLIENQLILLINTTIFTCIVIGNFIWIIALQTFSSVTWMTCFTVIIAKITQSFIN